MWTFHVRYAISSVSVISTRLETVADTAGIRHNVRDDILLDDAAEEVRVWSDRPHTDILASVGFVSHGNSSGESKVY
jgi:hypothetical protein